MAIEMACRQGRLLCDENNGDKRLSVRTDICNALPGGWRLIVTLCFAILGPSKIALNQMFFY